MNIVYDSDMLRLVLRLVLRLKLRLEWKYPAVICDCVWET